MKALLALALLLGTAHLVIAQSPPSSVVLPPGNIVINGGFESGFGGWMGTYGYLDPLETGGPVPALEGKNTGVIVDLGHSSFGQPAWQILPTTAGTHYFFKFSMLSGFGLTGSSTPGIAPVEVYWGGALFGVGSDYLGTFQNGSTTTWNSYGFEVIAHSDSTLIQFVDRRDTHWPLLDAVSVVPVPEPAAVSLILAGLGVLLLRRLSRQHGESVTPPYP